MLTSLVGAIVAYVTPALFGLALYLFVRKTPSRVEALAVSWGVAWAVVNIVTLLANQFLGIPLGRDFYVLTSAGLGIFALVLLIGRRERLLMLFGRPLVPRELRRGSGLAILIPLLILLLIIAYKGTTIPAASTDAVVYHMVLPQVALETATLPLRPGVGWLDVTTTLPNLLVTQQLWVFLGAGVADSGLTRPIMPIYSGLLLLLVFVDARRWFGLLPAALAAGGVFALNEFASLTIALWAEVPVAFFAYLSVRLAAAQGIGPGLLAAGVFAGAAILVKYNGLVMLVALASALLLLPLFGRGKDTEIEGVKSRIGWIAAFLVIGLLVASPLLLRNLLVLGNPVYPFFLGGVNTAQLAYFAEAYSLEDLIRVRMFEAVALLGSILVAGIAMGLARWRKWSAHERLFYLVFLLYLPIYLYFPFRGSYFRYLAPVLPVAALLAGRQLAWWVTEASPRQRVRATYPVLALLLGVLILLGLLDTRPPYVLEVVAVFFVSVGVVIAVGWARGRPFLPPTRAAVMVLFLLIAPAGFAIIGERYPPRETAMDIALLPQDEEAYLSGRFAEDWQMWTWMNERLEADALVLTFEPRLLYLDVDVLFGAAHELIPTYDLGLEDAVSFVRNLGVDYVLDSPWSHLAEANRVFWERSVVFQNLQDATHFRLIHTEGEVTLYELV